MILRILLVVVARHQIVEVVASDFKWCMKSFNPSSAVVEEKDVVANVQLVVAKCHPAAAELPRVSARDIDIPLQAQVHAAYVGFTLEAKCHSAAGVSRLDFFHEFDELVAVLANFT